MTRRRRPRGKLVEQLTQQLHNLGDAGSELARRASADVAGAADRIAHGARHLSEADRLAARRAATSRPIVSGGPRQRVLVPPLGPEEKVRAYTREEFIARLEQFLGRRLTSRERAVMDLGCVGLVRLYCGYLKHGEMPPKNPAFAHWPPELQKTLAPIERMLGPADDAAHETEQCRDTLAAFEQDRARAIKMMETGDTTIDLTVYDRMAKIARHDLELADHREQEIMKALDPNTVAELRAIRDETLYDAALKSHNHAENARQLLLRVLDKGPRSAAEFLAELNENPELRDFRVGLGRRLPNGNPETWTVQKYMMKCFLPESEIFRPDPHTGLVVVPDRFDVGRPGYVNYDYFVNMGDDWLGADHSHLAIVDPYGRTAPITVFQNSFKNMVSYDPAFNHQFFGLVITPQF